MLLLLFGVKHTLGGSKKWTNSSIKVLLEPLGAPSPAFLGGLTLACRQQGTGVSLGALPWPRWPIRMTDGLLGHETVVFCRSEDAARLLPPVLSLGLFWGVWGEGGAQPSALWKKTPTCPHHHHQKWTWECFNHTHAVNVTSNAAKRRKKNLGGNSPSHAADTNFLNSSKLLFSLE